MEKEGICFTVQEGNCPLYVRDMVMRIPQYANHHDPAPQSLYTAGQRKMVLAAFISPQGKISLPALHPLPFSPEEGQG